MLKMFEQLGTPEISKMKKAFPDAGAHVIACELTSKSYREVLEATKIFGEKILKLVPVHH